MIFGKDLSHRIWTSQELKLTGQTKREWSFDELLHFCNEGSVKSMSNAYYKVHYVRMILRILYM